MSRYCYGCGQPMELDCSTMTAKCNNTACRVQKQAPISDYAKLELIIEAENDRLREKVENLKSDLKSARACYLEMHQDDYEKLKNAKTEIIKLKHDLEIMGSELETARRERDDARYMGAR